MYLQDFIRLICTTSAKLAWYHVVGLNVVVGQQFITYNLDILSKSIKIRNTKLKTKEFDEESLIASELVSLAKSDFGVEVQVFSENDSGIYDPKGKAKTARPFKPAILIE